MRVPEKESQPIPPTQQLCGSALRKAGTQSVSLNPRCLALASGEVFGASGEIFGSLGRRPILHPPERGGTLPGVIIKTPNVWFGADLADKPRPGERPVWVDLSRRIELGRMTGFGAGPPVVP